MQNRHPLAFPEWDKPTDLSAWERTAERSWHAAVREGHVWRREVIHERAREHVASVNEFLNATRARLAIWDAEN